MNTASPTERFRRQHAELASLASEVTTQLAELDVLAADPQPIRRTLAVMAGKLKIHAAMEDEALYPRLLAHATPHVRETALSFRSDFGEAYARFLSCVDRWTPEAISTNPTEFGRQTRAAIAALGERIERENERLYALVDSLS